MKTIHEALAASLSFALAIGALPARGDPGGVVENGRSTGIPAAGFLFEPEVPFTSLKNVPTWSELEQLLDNPYAVTHDPATPGNDQGFPSYRATGITRRPGFGVTLPPLLVHPLNYNTTTGEEMRLINPRYPGGTFDVIDQLVESPAGSGRYVWTRAPVAISPGSERVEPGPSPIDYNNPVAADAQVCVTVVEANPPEGSILCGGDPGEPGYFGFGRLNLARTGYSTPAVPTGIAPFSPPGNPATPLTGQLLFDPARTTPALGGIGGFIPARDPLTGRFGLNKPSLRVPSVVAANGLPGRPGNPAYTANTDPAATTASNENDYIRSMPIARALGKALFWDMQVGSDGVQSCGSCHFNGTGTDTRTRNQLNPNHLGNDLTLQIGDSGPAGDRAANYALKASDFPLHKLADPEIAGDPACTQPLVADVSTIPYAPLAAGYLASQAFSNPRTGTVTVCDAANATSDVNDVVSSMGVHWGIFKDIAAIGTLVGPAGSVLVVAPDLRETAADCALLTDPAAQSACLAAISDPIGAFGGSAGTGEAGVLNQFRRVEPRNTPTMQAAAFNFDNFWDGRARHDFNGGSVFGAADPQAHVFACGSTNVTGNCVQASGLTGTRQIIRFTSIASLATGPGLSEFEMSFLGRNWSKIGKKLLQAGVTPLANQLVAADDSLLGPYSNQGGSACAALVAADRSPGNPAPGKPGLCINYRGLIRQAFYPALHQNTSWHLTGCYTDGRSEIHPNQCSAPAVNVSVAIPVLAGGEVVAAAVEPFDGYVLTPAAGAAAATDTDQFTQMEGNFSLFWGLGVNAWVQILVPDNTPFDQLLDLNPGAFKALGEPGEPGLVPDLLDCSQPGADPNHCFTPFGNFRRDPGVVALQNPTGEGGTGGTLVAAGGDRAADAPDPLLGLDIFFASNLSLKNPNFRTGRCGECHAIPTLTDHTMPFTSKINLMDAVAEFAIPGVELVVEPLARLRVITGFLLESEINENGQDAVERRIVDQSLVPNPVDGLAYPGATATGLPGFGAWTGAASAFLDNGMYNLGVRPISEDLGRGGNDAFGWPLSLATLMMKNLGGAEFNPGGDNPADGFAQPVPGVPMITFDPDVEGFGLFEATAQDPRINPGFEGEPANPLLPPHLGAFANNITVGDFPPEMDEAGGAIGGMVNTRTDVAMIEGFMDTLGPFNPGNVAAEVLNFGGFSDRPGDVSAQMGTWPNVNRVGRMGSFKAPQLRNVELTGPYFHNGGKLTLRQVVDFYTRGGDFPITNSAHRDFNLVNMSIEIQSNLSEAEKVALVDFLLELTDERNRFDRAPFDHPEVIIPVDGLAPDNSTGRAGLMSLASGGDCTPAAPATSTTPAVPASGTCFQSVPAVGSGGMGDPEPTFLHVTRVRVSGDAARRGSPECDFDGTAGTGRVSHYCH